LRKYLGGLVEIINPEAEDFIIASGSAVSQAREAIRQEAEQGRTVGLIKIKSIRPFPRAELIETLKNAKRILIPEFNQAGWLHKEVCATLYGNCDAIISAGPRVYGGMTMPTEMVLEWLAEARKQNS
jgi:pyruvate ferredoxin oxidoreductase alpha subunit